MRYDAEAFRPLLLNEQPRNTRETVGFYGTESIKTKFLIDARSNQLSKAKKTEMQTPLRAKLAQPKNFRALAYARLPSALLSSALPAC